MEEQADEFQAAKRCGGVERVVELEDLIRWLEWRLHRSEQGRKVAKGDKGEKLKDVAHAKTTFRPQMVGAAPVSAASAATAAPVGAGDATFLNSFSNSAAGMREIFEESLRLSNISLPRKSNQS